MRHTEKANAKINLYLNVVAQRHDGFHDIESVMQTIDLCDILHFDLSPSDTTEISLSFSEPSVLPVDERNLIVRAALAFLAAANKTARINVLVEKSIPMEAGLAGGSADAAATLRALDTMLPNLLPKEQLYKIAASLGSDIPFCLIGGRALCTGRGEKIESLPCDGGYFGIIATTEEASSTPRAYRRLDEIYNNFDGSVILPASLADQGVLDSVKNGNLPPFYNIFEDAVFPLCPRASEAKSLLADMGAEASMMSGSGPAVFALTKDIALAQKMKAELTARGFRAEQFLF